MHMYDINKKLPLYINKIINISTKLLTFNRKLL